MKRTILLTASAVLLALSMVSCKSDPIYLKSYFYEVKLSASIESTNADVNKVLADLNAVVGDNGSNMRSTISSPVDNQMKSGCAAVQQKYATGLHSVYFSFILQRVTLDPDPKAASQKIIDELAEYEFGDALQHAYAYYDYSSDIQAAQSTLRGMHGTLSDEDYKECGQTLIAVETAFSKEFGKFNTRPYLVTDENDSAIKKLGDDFYTEFSAKKNAVPYTYVIGRRDLLSGTVTQLWEKTFPANL